jgi:hypothetical protein
MKSVKLLLEYDLGEYEDDDHISESLNDWYEYIWQCDFDLDKIIIKKVIINDSEMENRSKTS